MEFGEPSTWFIYVAILIATVHFGQLEIRKKYAILNNYYHSNETNNHFEKSLSINIMIRSPYKILQENYYYSNKREIKTN